MKVIYLVHHLIIQPLLNCTALNTVTKQIITHDNPFHQLYSCNYIYTIFTPVALIVERSDVTFKVFMSA